MHFAMWNIFAAMSAFVCLTSAAPLVERAQNCVQGVMVIAARGTDPNWQHGNETDPDYADIGGLRTIGNAIVKAVGKGSFLAAVPYPASFDRYFTSVSIGSATIQGMIKNYTTQCKSKVTPKIVLLGYSQGAQAVSQALVGGNGQPALPSTYASSIVAGSIFADPTFLNATEPLDAGSNKNMTGVFPMSKTQATNLNKGYGKLLRSYCQYGDEFCASGSGSDAGSIHLASVQTYTNASETFLLALVKKYA